MEGNEMNKIKMTKKLNNKYFNNLEDGRESNTNFGYRLISIELTEIKNREHGEEIEGKLIDFIIDKEIDCFIEDGSSWFYDDGMYEFNLSVDEEYLSEFNENYKKFKKGLR